MKSSIQGPLSHPLPARPSPPQRQQRFQSPAGAAMRSTSPRSRPPCTGAAVECLQPPQPGARHPPATARISTGRRRYGERLCPTWLGKHPAKCSGGFARYVWKRLTLLPGTLLPGQHPWVDCPVTSSCGDQWRSHRGAEVKVLGWLACPAVAGSAVRTAGTTRSGGRGGWCSSGPARLIPS